MRICNKEIKQEIRRSKKTSVEEKKGNKKKGQKMKETRKVCVCVLRSYQSQPGRGGRARTRSLSCWAGSGLEAELLETLTTR